MRREARARELSERGKNKSKSRLDANTNSLCFTAGRKHTSLSMKATIKSTATRQNKRHDSIQAEIQSVYSNRNYNSLKKTDTLM